MPPLILRRLKNKGINDIMYTKGGDYIIKLNLDDNKIIELYKTKFGYEIANIFGVSRNTIYRRLKENNIKIIRKGWTLSEKAKKNMSKAKKGHPVSKETIQRLIERNTGRKASKETRKRMSETAKRNGNRPPSWQGKKHTLKTKKKMSESQKGERHHNYGRHLTNDHRKNISKALRGDKCYKWNGGISSLSHIIRESYKNRQWISDVFTRDNFICNMCGEKGCYLHAHHIKSFSIILQFYEITTLEEALECSELWNINNGMTLCKKCHKKIHKKVK